MSVSDGQKASALVFNTAFVSKTANSTMIGILGLNNGGSGAAVTNVQQAINTGAQNLADHLADTADAHDASAISNVPSGNLAATEVQAALNELQTDVDTRQTAAQVTAYVASVRGAANGLASLDGSGLVPASQLPSYVDDVLEYANLAAFPVTGETGKIYLAIDTGLIYRWTGSVYVNIASSAVNSVNGFTGVVVLTKSDISLGNVDNTSDATKNSAAVVLTNKDIDGGTASNTTRITIPKDTKTNLDALTRKTATIVYASDLLKAYVDNGTTLVELSTGSSFSPLAPTVQLFTSGSGTYTRPTSPTPLYLEIEMVAGGGGGGGSGTTSGTAATAGSNSTFGPLTAVGGGAGSRGGDGGAGGSGAGVGTGYNGQSGHSASAYSGAASSALIVGGFGGSSFVGPGGHGATALLGFAGDFAGNNTGGGGGGGAPDTVSNAQAGSGGGGGETVRTRIYSPSSTYSYAIGSGGTGQAAGTSGGAGGNGGSGFIKITEFYY